MVVESFDGSSSESFHCFKGEISEDTQLFIEEITEELRKGYGFVPFIGAGFSAPSGAPLVYELEDYLQRCICISLKIDPGEHLDDTVKPWNPRLDRWPSFNDPALTFDRGHWVRVLFEIITKRRDPNQRDDDPKADKLSLLSEAFGAMQDWRTALLFLSRLEYERRDPSEVARPRLGAPRQEVIDACFREVLKGKFPTLGHRMLAALAGALRLDILLTTNFDNLLERSFEAVRSPLELFDVQITSKLPDWSSVSDVRALVKIHGGHSSLRADYTLDETPSEEDKQAFLHYLLSAKGRKDFSDRAGKKSGDQKLAFQNHLLVIGFSAEDRRIRSFIEYVAEQLEPEFRVYWICHTRRDVDTIGRFVQDKTCTPMGIEKTHQWGSKKTKKTVFSNTLRPACFCFSSIRLFATPCHLWEAFFRLQPGSLFLRLSRGG